MHEQGGIRFYESCTLQSIENAVRKYILMGLLTEKRQQVKKAVFITNIQVTPDATDKIGEAFGQLAFFLPQSPASSLAFL